MPNKRRPHKRRVSKLASASRRGAGPSDRASAGTHSVKDLLARAVPVLSQAADRTARQAFWRPWLEARLPPDLPPRITDITERNGTLVVFADSPAWSARLRYALQELAAEVRAAAPHLSEVTVRVLPRPPAEPGSINARSK